MSVRSKLLTPKSAIFPAARRRWNASNVSSSRAPPRAFAHAPGAEAEHRHRRAGRKFAGTHKEHP
jgi:hypothetical protein